MTKTEMTEILETLPQFIQEMDADWCMVYDFIEAQVGRLTDAEWDEVAKVYELFNNDYRYWLTTTMNKNPYVQTLIEMGYDEADCKMVASAGVKKTFPLNIHGRIFNTQEEYDDAVRDYINGL